VMPPRCTCQPEPSFLRPGIACSWLTTVLGDSCAYGIPRASSRTCRARLVPASRWCVLALALTDESSRPSSPIRPVMRTTEAASTSISVKPSSRRRRLRRLARGGSRGVLGGDMHADGDTWRLGLFRPPGHAALAAPTRLGVLRSARRSAMRRARAPTITAPRGTGVSVTRWSPKPQREVRLLGPPLQTKRRERAATERHSSLRTRREIQESAAVPAFTAPREPRHAPQGGVTWTGEVADAVCLGRSSTAFVSATDRPHARGILS
jgi:hypothetical protein